MDFKHISVLLDECINNLNIRPDKKYIDGTLGGAGHSTEIIKNLNNGLLIGIDRDKEALEISSKRLEDIREKENLNVEFLFVHDNFNNIPKILKENNIFKVDGILLDLGVSSYQIDNPERGFSYMHDGDLDMRMDQSKGITAKEVLNTYSEENLIKIFREYGEEKYSRRVAQIIVESRKEKEIETTLELVSLIESVVPFSKKGGHRAKRIFQALRIEVNDELKKLENTIQELIEVLNEDGRLVIITFHSLEDRIVKKSMIEMEGRCVCPKDLPVCVCDRKSYGKMITKKPILPTEEEVENNVRSRSAKLRVFERKD